MEPLLALTPDGTCPNCEETAEALARTPNTSEVTDKLVMAKDIVVQAKDGDVWHLGVLHDIPSGTRIYADGSQPPEAITGQRNAYMELDLIWRGGRWMLGQYRFPD